MGVNGWFRGSCRIVGLNEIGGVFIMGTVGRQMCLFGGSASAKTLQDEGRCFFPTDCCNQYNVFDWFVRNRCYERYRTYGNQALFRGIVIKLVGW